MEAAQHVAKSAGHRHGHSAPPSAATSASGRAALKEHATYNAARAAVPPPPPLPSVSAQELVNAEVQGDGGGAA